MALIKCPECRRRISDMAVNCPNCGFPIALTPPPIPGNKPPPIDKHKQTSCATSCLGFFGVMFLLFCAFLAVVSSMSSPSSEPNSSNRSRVSRTTPPVARTSGVDEIKQEGQTYYVSVGALNVRLAPNASGKITNTIHRKEMVHVYEIKDGWARISNYYDGSVEGESGRVARWTSAKYLSRTRPRDLKQPTLQRDSRIKGIPKVGDGGLTKRDVEILYAAAKYYLDSGKCSKIEYGDKSVSRPGVYYVNCGGNQNNFFKPSDIPGLTP